MEIELPYQAPPVSIDIADDGSTVLTLLEDYRVELPWGDNFVIPAGFQSDGASVPRFFWRTLSPSIDPITLGPSIVHDWLYQEHICTRKDADRWYRNALLCNGYPSWKAQATYIGLRIGGGSHWN